MWSKHTPMHARDLRVPPKPSEKADLHMWLQGRSDAMQCESFGVSEEPSAPGSQKQRPTDLNWWGGAEPWISNQGRKTATSTTTAKHLDHWSTSISALLCRSTRSNDLKMSKCRKKPPQCCNNSEYAPALTFGESMKMTCKEIRPPISSSHVHVFVS